MLCFFRSLRCCCLRFCNHSAVYVVIWRFRVAQVGFRTRFSKYCVSGSTLFLVFWVNLCAKSDSSIATLSQISKKLLNIALISTTARQVNHCIQIITYHVASFQNIFSKYIQIDSKNKKYGNFLWETTKYRHIYMYKNRIESCFQNWTFVVQIMSTNFGKFKAF